MGWSHLLFKANSLLPSIWASFVYFLTYHLQHSQILLKSKHQSSFGRCKKHTQPVHGSALMSTICINMNIQRRLNPGCCFGPSSKHNSCKKAFPYLSIWVPRVPSQEWDAGNTLSSQTAPKAKVRWNAPPGVTVPAGVPRNPSPLLSMSHMNAKQGRKPMGPHSTSSAMSQLEKP